MIIIGFIAGERRQTQTRRDMHEIETKQKPYLIHGPDV